MSLRRAIGVCLLAAWPAFAAEVENPALAVGLNEVRDYSTQDPFIDLMKSARAWIGHVGEDWGGMDEAALRAGGYLDAAGWPVKIPENVRALDTILLAAIPPEATSFDGLYRISWQGEGRLRLWGGATPVAKPGQRANELWFRRKPTEELIGLSITVTDPRNTGDYLRDISVVRERHLPAFEAGALFNPDFLERIEGFRVLRFMDWMETNWSAQQHWADRPELGDRSWADHGVPLEAMITLANRVAADPWFNMPHMADDAYVEAFATMVRDQLDPRRVAYVEYSNEVWNFTFGQAQWLRDRASARWNTANDDSWMQLAGGRAAEVAGLWRDIFGSEAGSRLRNVVAVHTAWLGLAEPQLQAPRWVAEAPQARKAPVEAFDAYAISGYIGHDLGAENAHLIHEWLADAPEAAADLALDHVRETTFANWRDELLPFHAEMAARHGLDLVMYEGGSHMAAIGAVREDAVVTDFLTALHQTPQMATLYAELMAAWRQGGGRLFNIFVDVERPSKYGAWGALKHLHDETPRWQTIMDVNAQGAWWSARPGGDFIGTSAAER